MNTIIKLEISSVHHLTLLILTDALLYFIFRWIDKWVIERGMT